MRLKKEYVEGLIVLLDLPRKDEVQLNKLPLDTLTRIYEGQRKNALAYQAMANSEQGYFLTK